MLSVWEFFWVWPLKAGGAEDGGTYVLTGTDATTKHAWVLTAGAGSYTLTGTNATPLHAWKLSALAGSYVLTGTAASPLHGWKLAADAGSYALTGTDASLVLTGASLSLAADGGSYVLTGSDATPTQGTQAPALEVMWPRTSLRGRGRGGGREGPDYGLLRELVRNRDEAIAEYQRRNETKEEPEVRVEIPRGVSPEALRALREFLAPYKITPISPAEIGLVSELMLIEAQRLEMELQLIEEEELAIVLALAA